MKPIFQVLVSEFYRRNTLFFGILLILLVVIMRPAYLIFSPIITRPLLESPEALTVLGIVFFLYLGKCILETLAALNKAENRFIFSLAALPRQRVFFLVFLVILAISGPASLYIGVLSVYALKWKFFYAFILSATWLTGLVMAAFFLTHRVIHPRELALSLPIQEKVEAIWKASWTYLGLNCMWHRFRKKVLFHKLISLGMMGGLVSYHLSQPLSHKGLRLSLWSIACFQCILAYRYQQASSKPLFITKSLPIPRIKRWATFVLAGLLLFLPETLLACSLSPSLSTWPFWGAYWEIALAVFCLGIAVLHYEAPELTTYLGWGFGLFCVGFVGLLFNMPLWILGLAIFAFSSWIFWEEYYRSEVKFPGE